jgi:hypothetical protein
MVARDLVHAQMGEQMEQHGHHDDAAAHAQQSGDDTGPGAGDQQQGCEGKQLGKVCAHTGGYTRNPAKVLHCGD